MSKVIRVMQVVGEMNQGGIETAIMNVYRQIDRTKIQFDFAVHGVGAYDDEIRAMGGNVYYLPRLKTPFSIFAWQKAFTKLLELVQPVAVQSHVYHKSRMVLTCAKNARIPMRIAHSHGDIPLLNYLKSPKSIILRLFFKTFWKLNATHYWAITKLAGTQQFGKKIFNNPNFNVVKLAIDCERFRFNSLARSEIRSELKIPLDSFVIGHIGRMDKYKNQTFLLDVFCAFQKIARTHDHFSARLLLVGDGITHHLLEEKAKKLNIADRVIFAGKHFDTERFYSAMDFFVMPSIFEGLPVVSVEAQASGLPCLLSENINHDARIVPTLHFLSLKKTPAQWADNIELSHLFEERLAQNRLVAHAGWEISSLVAWLETQYLGIPQ